jgi:cytochrome c-type biogenesis protein CcmH
VGAVEVAAPTPPPTDVLGVPIAPVPEHITASDIKAILGPPLAAAPAASILDAEAHRIATKLRCPVCQGVAIADSPSGMAAKMRAQVRDLAALGYTEEQIFAYFERAYGEFVRLEPPARGINWLLWMAPAAMALAGAAFAYRWLKVPAATIAPGANTDSGSESPPQSVDPELQVLLEQVRRDAGRS